MVRFESVRTYNGEMRVDRRVLLIGWEDMRGAKRFPSRRIAAAIAID